MRILFIANLKPDPDSGAAGTEVQTINALRDMGVEVDTVWSDELSHWIRHYNLYDLVELPLAYRAAMLKRLSGKRYDVIHANQPHGYLAARALRKSHYPTVFVHRSHGFEGRVRVELARWRFTGPPDARSLSRRVASSALTKLLGISQSLITRYAHGHIVSASQCRDYLVQRHGVPHNRIAVIPQAPPPVYHHATTRPMTRERLCRLLYVGQFAFIKGTPILAEGATQLLHVRRELSLTWICAAHHHAAARALLPSDLANRVEFLDWCSQLELMKVYDQHGVFLFPSFFEGFGKAFVEAMARGLIVVASDNGGMRDVITHGANGFLFSTGDSQGMIRLCLSAVDNFAQSEAMSIAASQEARRYTWSRTARETAAFYERLRNA